MSSTMKHKQHEATKPLTLWGYLLGVVAAILGTILGMAVMAGALVLPVSILHKLLYHVTGTR